MFVLPPEPFFSEAETKEAPNPDSMTSSLLIAAAATAEAAASASAS